MSRGFSSFDLLTSILAGTATIAVTVISQQANAIAKSTQEVAQIAQTTTVQINNSLGDPGGTGVIVGKQGNTYTIVTANHVVRSTDAQYTVRTHTEKEYQVTKVQRLQSSDDGPDLALVTFTTPDEYAPASVGNSDQAVIGADIYVCGYPLPSKGAGKEREFLFTKGIVSSRPKTRPQGYTLRYDAITRKGMSGGPVFDILGRVVGIHGQADIDDSVAGDSGETIAIKTGINAGIPINIFVAMGSQTGVSVALDNTPTGDNPTARLSNPQTAKDFYARGISRFDQDDFQGAIENYTQALRLAPNYADAYSRRGAAKLRLIGDSDIELSIAKNRGALQAAVEDLNQALRFNPSDSFAYSYRGYGLYYLGEKQKAMEDANQALRLDPSDPEAYKLRGILRSDLNDDRGAIADYDRAIVLNRNDFYAYSNRSVVRIKQKEYQQAIEDVERAIKIKPNTAFLYLIRGAARFYQGDKQGAMEDINKYLTFNPNNFFSYLLRGAIRFQEGDNQGAMEDFDRSMAINPNFAETYYFRGNVRYNQKNYQQAISDYTAAIRLKPDYAQAYFDRGDAHDELEQYDRAIQDYTEAIRLQPDFAQAYYYRGLTRNNQKNYQQAIEDFTAAIRLKPDYAQAYFDRGITRYRLKQYPEAIADHTEAIRLKPDYTAAYEWRGLTRFQQGDKQGALADYQKVAELYQQQGNAQSYQQAQELIRKLQQEL